MTKVPKSDKSDKQLLMDWKAGDKRAGAVLLARHHVSITRFFTHRLGPDTDDLVQQTFLGLLEGIDRLDETSNFRAYLFGIARNKLLRAITERVRDRQRFDPGETSIAAVDRSPSSLLAVKDQHKLLLAGLRQLPVDVQIMLELHYWEKMKVKHIAASLDMNLNTVKTKMARGRKQLNEEMIRLAESDEQLQSTLSGLEDWAAKLRADLESR